jgi:hypothetical protein
MLSQYFIWKALSFAAILRQSRYPLYSGCASVHAAIGFI